MICTAVIGSMWMAAVYYCLKHEKHFFNKGKPEYRSFNHSYKTEYRSFNY